VATTLERQQRGLTALNVAGLSGIETLGAVLIAAVGLSVLGAFLILERRREIAILRSLGADSSHVMTGPAIESGVAVLGSLLIGVPVGLFLGALAVRVLGLFFALPPPVLVVPVDALLGLILAVIIASIIALSLALLSVSRERVAAVLRGV
jgi:putative ABC transport system permease protein